MGFCKNLEKFRHSGLDVRFVSYDQRNPVVGEILSRFRKIN